MRVEDCTCALGSVKIHLVIWCNAAVWRILKRLSVHQKIPPSRFVKHPPSSASTIVRTVNASSKNGRIGSSTARRRKPLGVADDAK